MKVNDYNEKTSQHVAFFTKDERFIGFRSGENAWGIAADDDDPNIDPEEVMEAEIIKHFVDEDGNDAFVVDLM